MRRDLEMNRRNERETGSWLLPKMMLRMRTLNSMTPATMVLHVPKSTYEPSVRWRLLLR
jgi:hypothetical protein